jgi:hypothetical protein
LNVLSVVLERRQVRPRVARDVRELAAHVDRRDRVPTVRITRTAPSGDGSKLSAEENVAEFGVASTSAKLFRNAPPQTVKLPPT